MAAEYRELNKKEMGARIKARRIALGMSREDLAKKMSVTAKTIANVEYGEKGLRFSGNVPWESKDEFTAVTSRKIKG